MNNIKTFEELSCWKASKELKNYIFKEVIPEIPESEKFRLKDQIIRSSRSISANIAEGFGRFHYLDNAKFCSIARGSCFESLDHIICAFEEGFIDEIKFKNCRNLVFNAIKILNGYIKYLKSASNKIE